MATSQDSAQHSPQGPRVLKRNVKRTVSLEGDGAATCVVKRFHAPGRLDRLRDGLRARRERRALLRLRALEFPVPRPLALRRRAGAWELVLEHVPGADLQTLLAGGEVWPAPPGRVAVRLGRLHARLFRAGLRLDDLHAGNVRIGLDGHPRLLDLARVRRRRSFALVEELAGLAAGVRERAPRAFRARFLLAFLREAALPALPGETPAHLVERIEARARTLRRARVLSRVPRWWRASGDTRTFARDELRGVVAVDVDDEALAGALAGRLDALGDSFEVVREDGSTARERWERLGRMRMHDLPAPRPVAFATAPTETLWLARPAGAARFEDFWSRTSAADRVLLAHAAGRTLGALDDRGLALAPESRGTGLFASEAGEVGAEPLTTVALVRLDPTGQLACFCEELSPPPSAAERAAFAKGFVDAHRGSAAETRRLRAELTGA